MNEKKIKWINVAKGIGIVLVVYGHVIIGIHNSSIEFKGPTFNIQESIIYSFHMPLFFFLSGVFAKKWAERDFKTAIQSKIKTLLYPYFIWSFIQGFIMYVLGRVTNGDMTVNELIKIPIEPIAQFWFLYVLFFCFLLYYGLSRFLDNKSIFIFSIILFLMTPFLKFWILSRVSFNFFFFVFGLTNIEKFKYDNLIYMSIFLISNVLIYQQYIPEVLIYVFKLLAGLSGILLTVCISKKLENSKVLNKLGSVSLSIYLMHIMAGSGVRVILLKIGIDNIILHIVIGTLFGIVLPLIADIFIKKLRLTKVFYGK